MEGKPYFLVTKNAVFQHSGFKSVSHMDYDYIKKSSKLESCSWTAVHKSMINNLLLQKLNLPKATPVLLLWQWFPLTKEHRSCRHVRQLKFCWSTLFFKTFTISSCLFYWGNLTIQKSPPHLLKMFPLRGQF